MLLGKRLDDPRQFDVELPQSKSVRNQGATSSENGQGEGQSSSDSIQLEIVKMRSTILEQIRLNQVIIISGETGCGKSTQVPQYIMEEADKAGNKCKILCTQPRRIACISIAKRVAHEMGQQIGNLVGYHISMDANLDARTKILFVTNGILLNYLTHNPSLLTEYTHIIIDEVHERDIDSDFILILFKLFLSKFPSVKLILMSATINAGLFARYFSKQAIEQVAGYDFEYLIREHEALNCRKADPKEEKIDMVKTWDNFDYSDHDIKSAWKTAEAKQLEQEIEDRKNKENELKRIEEEEELPMATILEIESRRKYDIKEVYLNELSKFEGFCCPQLFKMGEFNFNKKRAVLILEVVSVAVNLVRFLHTNEKFIKFPNKKIEYGGILVFLPGLNEITYFQQELQDKLEPQIFEELEIIPLHSTIAQLYENDVFAFKKNKRKVIVCTNIAESSLTIPDIIFVIDFCLSKEFRFDAKTQSQRLDLTWASKASCRQRTGRTGRVCDGVSFRMVSKDFYLKILDNFTEAEMLRSPLDKVILKICVLHEEIEKKNDIINNTPQSMERDELSSVNEIFLAIANKVFKDPRAVLQIAIEKPSFDQIDFAMNFLVTNGAFKYINEQSKEGKITFLGRVYSDLPCSLQVIKLLLYGHLFNCFEDVLTLGVMMMHPKSIWLPRTNKTQSLDYLAFYRRIDKLADGQFSDHILFMNMFNNWFEQFSDSQDLSKIYSRRFRINNTSSHNSKYKQYDWYRDHNVRRCFMQEILANRSDIKRRMMKFISLNDSCKPLKDMNPSEKQEHYLKIKLAVGGASMPYFAYGIFRPTSKQKNELSHIVNEMGLDPIHCVNLYELPLYKMLNSYNKTILEDSDLVLSEKYKSIKDEDKINIWKVELLKNIQNKYGKVEKLIIQPRVAYVQFNKESSDLSIRCLLFDKNYRKGLTSTISAYSMEDQGMTSVSVECVPKNISNTLKNQNQSSSNNRTLFIELNNEVMKMVENISDVAYNFTPSFENMFSGSSLVIETLSIANIVSRARPDFKPNHDGEERLFIVYSEEIQANNKNFLAKTSTLMPNIPFLVEIMAMIFGSTVYLEASDKYERLTHLKLGSSDIPLTYWLSRNDIITINNLRESLKKYFEEQDSNKSIPNFIWSDIMRLLNIQREPFFQTDQWFDYYMANLKVDYCYRDKAA